MAKKANVLDENLLTFEELFDMTMVKMLFREPFYANLLINMNKQVTTDVPTAAVYVTDNVNLIINPYFFRNLNLDQRIDLLKHECVFGDTVVETDKGFIKIKDIVNKKMKVKVLSLSKDGVREYKPIISYSKKAEKDYPNKHWVSLKYAKSPFLYKTPIVTNDHRMAYVDTPLSTEIKYDKAENCAGKYSIRKIDLLRERNTEAPQYNAQQLQVIIGMLLGDSSLGKNQAFCSVGSKIHSSYMEYKQTILGGSIRSSVSGYKKAYSNLTIRHDVTEQTKLLRELFYVDNKKTIRNIVEFLTPISLAFWYMDDGSWDKFGTAFLHTEGFTYNDQVLLQQTLKQKFDLSAEIMPRSGRKHLFNLKFKKASTAKLFKLIAPYVHTSMQYKIAEEFRSEFDATLINNKPLEYSIRKILAVTKLKGKRSALYDIGVKDNHNFFANNTLVHNCHHVINNHFVRFREVEPEMIEDKERTLEEKYENMTNASLMNQAADFAINEYLPNLPRKVNLFDKEGNKLQDPKTGKVAEIDLCIVKEAKKISPNLKDMQEKSTMEHYYTFLKQKQEENKKNGKGQGSGQGSPGDQEGDGRGTLDDHSYWHKSDASDEQITRKVKEVVNKAAEQTNEKDMGNLPGDVKLSIDKLNYVPRDWRQDIQRFAARVSEVIIEASRKRRNRRYGIMYAGNKIYPQLHLAVCWDSSGSMGEEERNQINAELIRLHNLGVSMTVIECDAVVQNVHAFDPRTPLVLKGGGGTAFKPAFEYIENTLKNNVDGVIYCTDGCCWGEKIKTPPFPVLWALTPPFDESHVKQLFNGSKQHTQTTKIEIKKKTRG